VPTYEYVCGACNTRHEVQQKMTDSSLSVCPSCGESALRKLFTNVGVVFKGSGFYRNDSREKSSSGDKSSGDKASGEKSTSDSGSMKSSTDSSSSASAGSSDSGSKATTSPAPKQAPAPASAPSST
jgi:putative FmdB family regulatory protein